MLILFRKLFICSPHCIINFTLPFPSLDWGGGGRGRELEGEREVGGREEEGERGGREGEEKVEWEGRGGVGYHLRAPPKKDLIT